MCNYSITEKELVIEVWNPRHSIRGLSRPMQYTEEDLGQQYVYENFRETFAKLFFGFLRN